MRPCVFACAASKPSQAGPRTPLARERTRDIHKLLCGGFLRLCVPVPLPTPALDELGARCRGRKPVRLLGKCHSRSRGEARLPVLHAGREKCVFAGLLAIYRTLPTTPLSIDAPHNAASWPPTPTRAGCGFSHASSYRCPAHLCASPTPTPALSTCVLPRAFRPWSH